MLGAILGSAASAGIGMLGSLFGGDEEGKQGMSGPQVITLPEYSWTQDNLRQSGEFVADNIQSMSEGKYPAYYQKAMPYIKENMGRSLKETFYGSPMGGPGVMDQIRSTGAATGVGPKATNAMTSKAMLEYSNKAQEIDEFLHQMGVGLTERGSYNFPALVNQAPRGPATAVMGGMQYNQPPQTSGIWDAMGSMAGNMPWEDMFQNKPDTGGGDGGDFYNAFDYTRDQGGFSGGYSADDFGFGSSPYSNEITSYRAGTEPPAWAR